MRNSSLDHDSSSSSSHSHREPHHVRHLRQDSQGGSCRFAHISTQTSCPSSSPSSSPPTSSSFFFAKAHFLCSRLCPLPPMLPKRYLRLGIFACLLVSTILVYVTLFRHPPPDQLLKMNGGKKDFDLRAVFGKADSGDSRNAPLGSRHLRHPAQGDNSHSSNTVIHIDDEEEEEEEKEEEKDEFKDGGGHRREDDANFWAMLEKDEKNDGSVDKEKAGESQAAGKGGKRPANTGGHQPEKPGGASEEEKKEKRGDQEESLVGKEAWDTFIFDNHYTVVGIVVDTCDRPREQLGTVIMLPDDENGGVKTRTYYNFTLQEDLSEGTFSIEIKYNGQGLYDNYWDICQMEEDLEPANRTFSCPIRRGRQHLVKEKHVPSYLPKGRYQSKAWVKDAKERLLVCGFSDFVL